jgi:GntR family histidine utilization transcriptional repressor
MATAKFAEIKEYIRRHIESGEWEENTRVP